MWLSVWSDVHIVCIWSSLSTAMLHFYPDWFYLSGIGLPRLSCYRCGSSSSFWSVEIEWLGVGVVVCLERGADCLHMVHLMPLPSQNPIISCFIYIQTGLPFWYRLTQAVLEKRMLNDCNSSKRFSLYFCVSMLLFWFYVSLVGFIFFQYRAKWLAGKNVFRMTYFISSGA